MGNCAGLSVRTATWLCTALLALASFVSLSLAASAQETSIIRRGDAVVTGFAGVTASGAPTAPGASPLDEFFIDLEGPSAQILSLGSLGVPPEGQLVAPRERFRLKAGDIGQVFAIALDGDEVPNIYLGATSAFGLRIVAPDANGRPKRLRICAAGSLNVPVLESQPPISTPT